MREYGRVGPTFWTRGTGKELRGDPDAQLVALYLMSAPGANMIGLFYVPVSQIAHDTGCAIEGVERALARLAAPPCEAPSQAPCEGGFLMYSRQAEYVFVHTMARWQLGLEPGEVLKADGAKPDNRCLGAVKQMRECKDSALLQSFWEEYRDVFHLPDPWWPKPEKQAPPQGPSQAPCKAPSKPSTSTSAGTSSSTRADQHVGLGTRPAGGSESKRNHPTSTPATPAEEPTDVERVFEYWRSKLMPGAKSDGKRKSIIERALKSYSVEELFLAVDGTLLDDHRMGRKGGRKYVECDLVFRSADKIDPMIELAKASSAAIEPEPEPRNEFEDDPDDPDPPGEQPEPTTPERLQGIIEAAMGGSDA